MKKPFLIDYEVNNYIGLVTGITGPIIGLVIPTSDRYCDIIWNDGMIKRKHEIYLLSRNKVIKSDLTEQEVLAWRLKHGA